MPAAATESRGGKPVEAPDSPTQSPVESPQGAPIEAAEESGNGTDDGDGSSVGDYAESSTASLSASILEYRRFHGRDYHSEKFTSSYFLPNDGKQLDSVEITHHYLLTLLDEKLYLAPVKGEHLQRVLDVGTGNGIWAIELADQYPNAEVIGTDLSPCQPQWVPPNVRFLIEDATLSWTWDSDFFDFIHVRYLFGAVKDWTSLFKEAYRCCTPGGWVQSSEADVEFCSDDGTLELEPDLKTYKTVFERGGEALGIPFFVKDLQVKAFEEAGFEDIKAVDYKIPVGRWPKDRKLSQVGELVKCTMLNDIEGYTLMLCVNVLKWDMTEYQLWLVRMRKALSNPRVHSYMKVRFVYGRKPA